MIAAGARAAPRAGTPARRRLVVTGRAAVLLDVLMGLSVLAGLTWAASMTTDPRLPAGQAGAYLVVLAMVALWVARRLREQRGGGPARRLVVVLAVLGLAGLFVSDGPGSWPLCCWSRPWPTR